MYTHKVDLRDPLAVAVAALFGILGTIGIWSALGLSPDDVAQLFGYTMTLAAAHRTLQALWKRPAAPDSPVDKGPENE